MCRFADAHVQFEETKSPSSRSITCCSEMCCGGLSCQGDNEADDESVAWEDLLPDLESDEGELLEPLPEFGDPPAWADLDDWDDDE